MNGFEWALEPMAEEANAGECLFSDGAFLRQEGIGGDSIALTSTVAGEDGRLEDRTVRLALDWESIVELRAVLADDLNRFWQMLRVTYERYLADDEVMVPAG